MAKIEMMQDDGEKRHNSPEHTWTVDQNGGFYEKKKKKKKGIFGRGIQPFHEDDGCGVVYQRS